MSSPNHHLEDEVLLDYVSGAASEPVALVAACHLTLCAHCRAREIAAEAVGGTAIDHAPAVALSDGALERVLARLDGGSGKAPGASFGDQLASPASHEGSFIFAGIPLPRPMAPYLDPHRVFAEHDRVFPFVAPGVRGFDLSMRGPTGGPSERGRLAKGHAEEAPTIRTRLLRLAPGTVIPRHAHAAPELTLVFAGGLADGGEHYGRGDFRFRDTAAVHEQMVVGDEPCIALVVNEGALLPQTWRGWLASLLFDRKPRRSPPAASEQS